MGKKICIASSVNRTRASSMATMNSTTRPMMLVDVKERQIVLHIVYQKLQRDSKQKNRMIAYFFIMLINSS